MAIDKKLQIFDDEGNPVDYDIMATDVKFADGKDLPTKLDELEDEIGESQGGYTPPPGGIPKTDLAPSVQQTLDDVADKVDKVDGKGLSTNDYTTADKTKLAGIAEGATANQGTVTGVKVGENGEVIQPTNGVVELPEAQDTIDDIDTIRSGAAAGATALQPSDVTVSTPSTPDGTVGINVGGDSYTVNLNHTHENMAKLIVCEESDLPSTLEPSSIYAVKNGDETGIETVYFGGLPFTASAPQQLPYDAEVEYLQSTGTQYIGTGVQVQSTFKCEIKAQFDQNNDGFDTLVGALDGSTNYGVVLGLKNSSGGGSIYSQLGGDGSIADCAATPLALHVFTTQLMNGTISIDADGVSGTHAFSGSLPTNPLFLFARNKATVGNFCNAKIYYCKIWNGGALIRNFIPVRVGQVGYMYDKVSKQLFENIGSGSFSLGNDKQ